MKKTLFAACVAAVALLATSCQKELPKAVFTYEVEDLNVTFTNLSTNADSYTWDFGDGQTSTEANPIHTYAQNGTYNVVLTAANKDGNAQFSETVVLKTAAVKIDGKFEDWDKIIADKKGVYTELETGVEYQLDAIKRFAAYMDADYIYFMIAFDQANVMPLDMYLGMSGERVDENPCTHYWAPLYCDYLVEFGKGDTFEADEANFDWADWHYCTLFAFDVATGGWAFNQLTQNICETSEKVLVAGNTYVEGRMPRAAFPSASSAYVYISCNTSNTSWAGSGMAPAAKVVEGEVQYQEQLKLEQGE